MFNEYVEWAKPTKAQRSILAGLLRNVPNADQIMSQALEQEVEADQVIAYLQTLHRNENRTSKKEVEVETEAAGSSEVEGPKRSFPWKKILIGIGAAVVLGLIVLGIGYFNSNPIDVRPTLPTPQVPSGSQNSQGGLFGADAISFTIKNAPRTLAEILSNWVGWIILIFMMRLLITTFKSETADRREPKDYSSVMRGFVWFVVLFVLAEGIAPLFLNLCAFIGRNCAVSDGFWVVFTIRVVAAAIVFGSGLGAATGGNWDASPISVSLFLIGTVFKLGWPQAEFAGNAIIVLAVIVHLYEMWRHQKERVATITGILIATLAFAFTGYLVALGINVLPIPHAPQYRLVGGYLIAVLAAIGASSSMVQRKVGAVFPGALREQIQDPEDTVFFDLKLFTIMVATAAIIVG